MKINAKNIEYRELNQLIKKSKGDITIDNCIGQRYIASGLSNKKIKINGTPGNALGAYLDGAEITVLGNVQDATGDTMNDGKIIVHGSAGDALGYAMRGGRIYVRGHAGYRTGIHMKEYETKKPVIIVGESAGSFLGEYLAGGILVVLGLSGTGMVVGNFPGTGMHGGKILLRGNRIPQSLPPQISISPIEKGNFGEVETYLREYCEVFSLDYEGITKEPFFILKPNSSNPYHQMYVTN
ncbi:MAG: glutamate synthase [Christensenellaceae bacterium]|jgi:glutamate synthase domain-containing protein 3|nr:glutamate synthase [Christensenellaceae bacterium]